MILKDGVTRNPRYLYSLTISSGVFPNLKERLISLPVLLNIMHFVLSRLTCIRFLSVYSMRFFNMLLRPFSVSDKISKSSAHIRELRYSVSSFYIISFFFFFMIQMGKKLSPRVAELKVSLAKIWGRINE